MSELKLCPFCGGEVKDRKLTHTKTCYFSVLMKSIQYSKEYPYTSIKKPSDADLDGAWNNRPHENKLKAEAVVEAAEKSKTIYYAGNERACSYPELLIFANKLKRGEA